MNASLGTRVTLPAGVNTTANEQHPDITTDGKRLVFERGDLAAGTIRIILVDISTGQSSDLFTGFEQASRTNTDPSITPNGSTVATGGPFGQAQSTNFSDLTLTDVRGFPNGSYPRGVLRPQYGFVSNGQVSNPDAGGNNLFSFTETRPGTNGELILSQLGGTSAFPQAAGSKHFPDSAVAATDPQFVLLEEHPVTNGVVGGGDITFRPASTTTFVGTTTRLPAIVNSARDESQPAFSPDGRYVAFVRRGSDGHDRLFIWDSQTQTMLNTNGVDLGALATASVGNVSIYSRLLFNTSLITSSGLITANLLQSSGVGILVQRIVGRKKRILGRRTYKLKTVGRVPLGKFKGGRLRTKWDLKVDGKALRPGKYLVTPRGVGSRKRIRELGKPRVIKIKRKQRR
jgi:hypothetical protein